jgi:hypothetical protein
MEHNYFPNILSIGLSGPQNEHTFKKIDIDGHIYTLYHDGLENQKAYQIYFLVNGRRFYAEMIYYPILGWAYHIERNDNLISDSRLREDIQYFETAKKCHLQIAQVLNKYLYE